MDDSQTLASWTKAQLQRFIQSVIRTSPANIPASLTLQQVTATEKLIVGDQLELSPQAIAYLHKVMGV